MMDMNYCDTLELLRDMQIETDSRRGSVFRNGSLCKRRTTSGYIRVHVGGTHWYAHRLMWFMNRGEIPKGAHVDHINGKRDDNRLCNLRLTTVRQNSYNQKTSCNSTSGIKGVVRGRDKWKAHISIPDVGVVHLGTFDSKELAHEVRLMAEILFYGQHRRTL